MEKKYASLAIRKKTQAKATKRNRFTPTQMERIKSQMLTSAGENPENPELSDTAGGSIKGYSCFGKKPSKSTEF